MVDAVHLEILQLLQIGREALQAALDGVDEQLAVCSPGPGRWSILECVEHLAVAEEFLFSRLTKASRSDQAIF
jgi:hypothetical protein